MLIRAIAVWLLLLAAAVANGAIRETFIVPRTGAGVGHLISTVMLCLAILALTWLAIGWIHPVSRREAWMVGGVWLALTLAFEFLAGHYLFGNPWSRLFEDYNVLRGRVWLLVLVTTACAPPIAASARGLK
jgi:hypothetical protein